MELEQLVSYFSKKIAKPIAFNIGVLDFEDDTINRFYVVEPTAVSDDTVHVLVNFKYQSRRTEKLRDVPRYCGEVEIPLREGDSVQEVLDMAIAKADFGRVNGDVLASGQNENRIIHAFEKLSSRLEEAARPPGP